jgi:hypothetical protein
MRRKKKDIVMTQFTDDQMLLSDAAKEGLAKFIAQIYKGGSNATATAMLKLACVGEAKLTTAQVETLRLVLRMSAKGSIKLDDETHYLIEDLLEENE